MLTENVKKIKMGREKDLKMWIEEDTKALSDLIRIFLNPQLFPDSGYGLRPHSSSEFGSESEYFWICSLEWKKNIRNVSDNVWTTNPYILESDDRDQSLTEQ